ncbi:MAG: NAD(+)/NADH kinase [Betaproteobacteria bacterium AqS2]|uniref:NAD kinase n=1 Tax=Candidatus Amphirhobacter heronislandensis TaxID=1732024 RepID=A0A930XXM2_9GAMM|nr:NAD(+)/NADH kinase [Betaproteobacteria bacterium AqS2]
MAARSCVALAARIRGRDALIQIAQVLRELDHDPVVDETSAASIGAKACREHGIKVRRPDARPRPVLAIALGGDGSFIQMAGRYAPQQVPLIGVNLGRVGFLADIPHHKMRPGIEAVLKGRYRDEMRIMLAAEHWRGGRRLSAHTVINDAVIDRGASASLISMAVHIDRQASFELRADGLVVSTPSGSTAYSMSAGGPIITPDCRVIAMTPINPHSLTHRPLVFDDQRRIEVRALSEARLSADGGEPLELRPEDTVVIKAHQKQMTMRHPIGYDYFDTLRTKLYWRLS